MRIWVMCCTGCCSGVVRCGVFGVVCVGCRCCLLLCFCLELSCLDFCVFFSVFLVVLAFRGFSALVSRCVVSPVHFSWLLGVFGWWSKVILSSLAH